MPDSVTLLQAEIVNLERELSKRRQALTILSGAATPTQRPIAQSPVAKSPPGTSPATKSPAVKSPAAKRPALKSPAAKPPAPAANAPVGPSLAERIVTHLTANTGKLFTSAQITTALAKTDTSVSRANVQRRLSDLFSGKRVTRADGHYGVA